MYQSGNAALDYILTTNNAVSIVWLTGEMNGQASRTLDRCVREITASQGTQFVFVDFSKLVDVKPDVVPALYKFQSDLRENGYQLRICNIPVRVRHQLIELRLFREGEVVNSLKEALMSIMTPRLRQAA